ncbi:helix-turn-helix domain-containing protein [Mycobacterium sp.]|uniref:helix-turn-helix domain-containing protein n=1 Tax=Mycobacterium sp. TaxID=1785 RepID=UPI002C869B15|nr:helix-turn-helix domain-containing protein [Mycobacterium sp.]HKP43037.1 helix-turn-helix domain-containing protein [Mycobacterium sp.]
MANTGQQGHLTPPDENHSLAADTTAEGRSLAGPALVDEFTDASLQLAQADSIEALLQALTSSTRELVGADCGYACVVQDAALRIVAHVGIRNAGMVANWRLPVGQGIGGRVVTSGTTHVIRDYRRDPRRLRGVKSLVDAERLISGVVIPIAANGEPVGALFLGNRYLCDPTRWPTELLEALVAQAGFMFARLQSQHDEEAAHALLAEQHQQTQWTEMVSRQILSSAATSGGLSGAVTMLAEHLHASCVLLNDRGQPLATAGQAYSGDRETVVEICADDRFFGTLRARGSSELGPAARHLLEHIGPVLALAIERERAVYDAERRLGARLFEDLMSERAIDEPTVRRRAHLLEIDLTAPRAVMALGLHAPGMPAEGTDLAVTPAIIRSVEQAVGQTGAAITVELEGRALVVVVDIGSRDEADLAGLAQQILSRSTALSAGHTLVAGLGRPCHQLLDYRRSRADAVRALELARARSACGLVAYDQLGLFGLLTPGLDARELIAMSQRVLAPLWQADNTGAYVETLSAFLANNRNLKPTAAALHVHPNTVRYRISRISKLLGISLSDVDRRFTLELALRLQDALNGLASQPVEPPPSGSHGG